MPPSTNVSLAVAVSCQSSGGKLSFSAMTPNTVAAGADVTVTIRTAAGAYVGSVHLTGGGAQSRSHTGSYSGLANGTYLCVAYDDDTQTSSGDRSAVVSCSTSPGGGGTVTGRLVIIRVDMVECAPPRSATGEATPRARTQNGSVIGATDVVEMHLGDFVWTACTKAGADAYHTFTGLTAGDYTVYGRLRPGGGLTVSQTFRDSFRLLDVQVLGCTDPSADNYDPGANVNDGSCTYSALVPKPAFAYPRLNALRMIEPVVPDNITKFRNADNSLDRDLIDLVRRDGGPYCQKWCSTDGLIIQFRSNYATAEAVIVQAGNNAVIAADNIPIIQRTTWRGQTRTYRGWLTPEYNPNGSRHLTLSRAYFLGGVLPTVFSGGDRIIITNAGAEFDARYAVQSIGYDPLSEIPYVLINLAWPVDYGPDRVNTTILSEYDALPADVYEFAVPLNALPVGTYQVKLTVAGGGALYTARTLISEPFAVAPTWPGTLHILYQNFNPYAGLTFSTGWLGMLRIEGDFAEAEPGGSSLSYTNPDGSTTLLAATRTRRRRLEVFGLPAYLIDLLDLVVFCDDVRINGLACRVADSGLDVRYPGKRWTLANGGVLMQLPDADGGTNADPPSSVTNAGGGIIVNGGHLNY